MAAASAAFGVVDINAALHDGGCAGDQTHSRRAAAVGAGYRSYSSNAAAVKGSSNRSVHCRYRCRLLEAAGACGAFD